MLLVVASKHHNTKLLQAIGRKKSPKLSRTIFIQWPKKERFGALPTDKHLFKIVSAIPTADVSIDDVKYLPTQSRH